MFCNHLSNLIPYVAQPYKQTFEVQKKLGSSHLRQRQPVTIRAVRDRIFRGEWDGLSGLPKPLFATPAPVC